MQFWLEQAKTALLVVDVQEKLMHQVERPAEMLRKLHQLLQGFSLLLLPIFVTEQYPEGLGPTVELVKDQLGPTQEYLSKTTFSCCQDQHVRETLLASGKTQWIIAGIEAHVCVMQTAKNLVDEGMQVTVLNDAITSRSIYDYSTAIAEMRDCGVRISSVETILFELVRDSQSPHFKELSQLIKSCSPVC